MKRRDFITLLGGSAALWPLAARAQKLFKIGLLDTASARLSRIFVRGKLAELGYVEGRNIVIERKSADGMRHSWQTLRMSWCASTLMSL